MPRRLEGNYTHEQMRKAEEAALVVLKEVPEAGPIEALSLLALCLFGVVQQTNEPTYTEQQMNDAGILILEHYQLSPEFPFSNQQIIDEIKQRKAGK